MSGNAANAPPPPPLFGNHGQRFADSFIFCRVRDRDPRANYEQSMEVLAAAKAEGVYTKSSLMLGLGETTDEIKECMKDLRAVGVDILTLGQYLQPTPMHLNVREYLTPEAFDELRVYGEEVAGFRFVASGPLVRSSYKAGEFFIQNMIEGDRSGAALPPRVKSVQQMLKDGDLAYPDDGDF